jgi:hypothetical protein
MLANLFMHMIRHIDDDNAMLAFKLTAEQVRGVGVQDFRQATFCNKLRYHNSNGFTRLPLFRNFRDVSQ